MATEWTPSQRAGVTTVGRGLLVSAAAGSGKTTVLAGRCAHLVCDAPPPYRCEVDQLLVLTFTRATAAEMRHRVDGALRARIAATPTDHPEHGRLEAQSRLIDRAAITTLDSFCGRLLRRHFQAVGLDPNFTTLDEHEAKLLRRDVARELFDAQYDGPRADAFTDLIDRWGDGDDSKVIERVESLHNLMTGMADPERWRAEAAARAREAADGSVPLGETRLGKALAGAIAAELRGLVGRCDRLADGADRAEGLGAYASHVRELREWPAAWLAMAERGDLAELAAAVGAFEKPGIPRLKTPFPPEKDAIKDAIDKLKKELKEGEVAQLCGRPEADWRAGMAAVAGPTAELLDLTAEFGRRYARAKDALRAVDFADLGRLALRVLTDPATGGPSRAAESLHREFRHVLVDEYQDINELQDALLNRMSTECMVPEVESNLFRVGDVKQSIYGFRLAEPRRFVGLFDRLRGGASGELILLSENFRSRAPLLGAVNFAFSKLMTEEAAEIDYSDGHTLVPGAMFATDSDHSFSGAPVELHLLIKPDGKSNRSEDETDDEDDDDLDAQEREATVIAKRLHELKASKLVHDKAGPRPMKWSDAAVLLRSTKEKAERFAVALRACGVPVHADAKTGFFGAVEVRDVIALLRVLDNRRQDVPLAAVLRSPLAELPDREDALARIRLASPDRAVPFHEAAARYAAEHDDDLAERLRRVLADLGRWRDLTRRRPLAEALWAIYTETGYLAFCAGLPGGAQRAANLVELHERARQFGTFQRQGLARFLAFLDDLSEAGDLGQPSVASEADDVVRVMSIHTAKGLEFPVVVIPDLGKGHNLTSSTGSVLFDRELGVGMEVIDGERHVRYPSLGSLLVGRSLRRQAVAEELRVLYVAMTRAKEHLILVGGAGEQEVAGWASKWAGHIGPMPATDVLAGGSMLAWLGPVAVAGRSVKGHTFEMWKHGGGGGRGVARRDGGRPRRVGRGGGVEDASAACGFARNTGRLRSSH